MARPLRIEYEGRCITSLAEAMGERIFTGDDDHTRFLELVERSGEARIAVNEV